MLLVMRTISSILQSKEFGYSDYDGTSDSLMAVHHHMTYRVGIHKESMLLTRPGARTYKILSNNNGRS